MKRRVWIALGLLAVGMGCLPEGLLPGGSPTAAPLTPAPSPTPIPPLTAAPSRTPAPLVETLPSPTPMPPLRNPRAEWAIVEERSWSAEELGGIPISLSPEGRWLLTGGAEGFCLHPTEDPTQRQCYAPGEGAGMTTTAPGATAWAPDGKWPMVALRLSGLR